MIACSRAFGKRSVWFSIVSSEMQMKQEEKIGGHSCLVGSLLRKIKLISV